MSEMKRNRFGFVVFAEMILILSIQGELILDFPTPEVIKARRLCGSKAEWRREVDFSECVSKENLELQDKLEDLRKNFSLVIVHELMNGLEKASKGLYGGDLVALAKIMVGTVDLTESSSTMNYSDADRINEVVLKKTSMLLHPSNYVSWMELPKTNQSSTATRLLRSVESSLTILAKSLNEKRNFSRKALVYPGIEAWVYVLEHNTENSISTPYSNDKVDYLSSKDIIQEAGNGSRHLTVALFDYMYVAQWLHVNESANKSPKQNSSSAENESSSQVSPEIVVNTRVMSVSVVSRSGKNAGLEEKVRYTLKHKEKKSNGSKPMCVFWKYSTESFEGHWSNEGCRDVSNCLDCSYTVCECDHLTSFAVLMPVSGVDLGGSAKSTYRTSVGHEFALFVITYICCTISIICLALAFITFYWFKDLQCVRNTIHKNLVLCLFIADVIFLLEMLAEGQYEHKVLCAVVAGFLHYFFLASFSWMFLEGVQLYILLVKVFEARTSFRLRRYYLCGYGAPALIVFISAIVTYVKGNSYAAHHYCWLSTDDGLIWAFSGPATVIIFVNLVVLIVVICRIHTSKASSLRPEEQKSKTKTIASSVRGAIVLMVLLGTPWIVGFFDVNEESIFMSYIFTILNSLQGFFIFVFHCLTCEKVQKEYRRCIQRCICLPGIRSG